MSANRIAISPHCIHARKAGLYGESHTLARDNNTRCVSVCAKFLYIILFYHYI